MEAESFVMYYNDSEIMKTNTYHSKNPKEYLLRSTASDLASIVGSKPKTMNTLTNWFSLESFCCIEI
jgi:hypothetical protein